MRESRRASSMRFIRIELKNWRNFTHLDVALSKRVFLIGPNASGKSNLLDTFRFLRDIVSVGGGLQEAVRKRGGVSTLRFWHRVATRISSSKPKLGMMKNMDFGNMNCRSIGTTRDGRS
jgi:ABC-type molybdenum transport system ATPase subunit/photorepair protein PhrA